MKKNRLGFLLAASVLVFSLAGCGTAASVNNTSTSQQTSVSQEKKTEDNTGVSTSTEEKKDYTGVTIRIATRPADLAKYDLEEALGFWEEEFAADGIKVEPVKVKNGSDFVDSISSGSVDIGIFGDQPILSGIANGKSLKVVGRTGSDAQAYVILVRKDSDIQSITDLKGKTVAIKPGGNTQKIWTQVLAANGLTIDDVDGVNIDGADALIALNKGELEAVSGYSADGKSYKDYKVLVNYSEIAGSVHLIAASLDFTGEYPELVARVLKVYQKTSDWLANNRDEAIKQFENIGDLDEEAAIAMYEGEAWNVQWDKSDEQVINYTASWLYSQDILKNEISAEKAVDTQYLKLAGLYVGEDINY